MANADNLGSFQDVRANRACRYPFRTYDTRGAAHPMSLSISSRMRRARFRTTRDVSVSVWTFLRPVYQVASRTHMLALKQTNNKDCARIQGPTSGHTFWASPPTARTTIDSTATRNKSSTANQIFSSSLFSINTDQEPRFLHSLQRG